MLRNFEQLASLADFCPYLAISLYSGEYPKQVTPFVCPSSSFKGTRCSASFMLSVQSSDEATIVLICEDMTAT
eukprot:303980-Chlamydomonas_euryale.AAC.9